MGKTLACPAGFACDVQCTGGLTCYNTIVTCPADYDCNVTCHNPTGGMPVGLPACSDLHVNCGATGTCELSCIQGGGTIECDTVGGATTLTCGTNKCAATCTGTVDHPTVTCGNACGCTHC